MKYGIQYLCHLVETKNDLDRKRRRFRALARPSDRHDYNPHAENPWTKKPPKPAHKSFPVWYAETMHASAMVEMRSMTKEMRALRTELGVKFHWKRCSWNIDAIQFEGTKLDLSTIASLAKDYRADSILLK